MNPLKVMTVSGYQGANAQWEGPPVGRSVEKREGAAGWMAADSRMEGPQGQSAALPTSQLPPTHSEEGTQ